MINGRCYRETKAMSLKSYFASETLKMFLTEVNEDVVLRFFLLF